ncbi:PDZ domain-containing protein [Scopulibacillus darangshiensis]|uniref:endopeptidase La n=1 Tax=Scopulibacillus darangshiensis TaxID=442528 RepID=A0A4R2P6K7_9BACL|nr:SepM family pheromone-processing serine protease [Scopulibacillus darangshiensis]TCP30482.1 PDZ domain-containing protein [Scopulibacillus darangshiensis]
MKSKRRTITFYGLIIILIIAVALNFYKLPYYVEKPGAAESVNGIIKVKDGHKVNGQFMLVYIYVGAANVYQYLWAKYDGNDYTNLLKAQNVKLPDENQKEYALRQQNYMVDAQETATYVAYKAAGKKPKINNKGILILNVISDMPAAKELEEGDIIVGANGKKVETIKDLQPFVKGLKPDDSLSLKIKRDGKVKTVNVDVGKFPGKLTQGKTKYGIGIIQSNERDIEVKPKISFDIKNIGGPSAGLMMTLEIYDQLTNNDLAKGFKIAGTGTIQMDGKVGPIGGIKEKVVGADKSGAQIFFAPTADHEAKDAKEAAKDIGTDMKIVPVSTFDDAVKYLNTLK